MSDVVRKYYDSQVEIEWGRLERPYRRFELVSTLHLIKTYFPSSGHLVDIGGGPGRYTAALLERGYRVTLVDLSEKAIAFARARLAELGLTPERTLCADARDLSLLPSAGFDGALLLGPMYHLIEEEDRQKALSELRRILRPGGRAMIAFINPWGILRSGLAEFPSEYADYKHVSVLLGDQIKAGEQEAFTEAVFLTPSCALAEIERAGLDVITYAGVEGFAAGMLSAVERIATEDPPAYENILHLVAETCELPQYRDCTEHLHVLVQRPPN
jgi:SAM-dependent methyltransferase